jgi:ferric-dicitrate binding protein FerR (iron transport regulator)
VKNFDDKSWTFLQDDRFIAWVNQPDEDNSAYWEQWMQEHPGHVDTLLKAKQIILGFADAERTADAEALAETIWTRINADTNAGKSAIPLPVIVKKPTWYWMAASIAGFLLLGTGIYYYRNVRSKQQTGQSERLVASVLVNDNLERTNHTGTNQVVYLVDGSKVILQPGASIKHTVFLQKDKREIYLQGNAFFEVAKDPSRPFYVYAKDLVMQVLGTSFHVTTDRDNGDVTVVVSTGKVSVYKKSGLRQELGQKMEQLILTPNQKALYQAQARSLVQSDMDSRELSLNPIPSGRLINFNFEEMPVTKIFKTLENGYGVPFYYDEKTFSNCVITTSLSEETFEEKLKIICTAIGATYRIQNNGVSIEGHPCNYE